MNLFLAILLATAATTPKPTPPPDLNAPPAAAVHLEDGLITMKLVDGTGTEKPQADGLVKLRYSMWRPDGKLVDVIGGNLAAVISVSRMMPGWAEATKMMVVGEKRRTWIPAGLGGGKIPDGSSLVIDAELVDLIHGPRTPADVAAPPADAESSRSGLAWKVMAPGNSEIRPNRRSTVVVNYSGWTTDGRLFDSTVLHGKPAELPLGKMIRGWAEGIPMMKVGEIRRFWIPAKLAYADQPEKPQGMLVFDVQLLAVK